MALAAMKTWLADIVLMVHFLFVLFVLAGLPLIWIGAAFSWRWVRNPYFRLAHLGAIGFVAFEAVIGMVCPLTLWEDVLRSGGVGEVGFIDRWVGRLLYYDLPPWVFTASYLAFALAVAITYYVIPPARFSSRTP
jgi:Protein of Unknown function (DUF2784)